MTAQLNTENLPKGSDLQTFNNGNDFILCSQKPQDIKPLFYKKAERQGYTIVMDC